jgi:hypothetical protein
VSIQDATGNKYVAETDARGYYTRTLPTGSYALTASAYGYAPATVTGVLIKHNQASNYNFYLEPAPVATIAPPMLAATLHSGGSISETLRVTNAGKVDLLFAVKTQDQVDGTGGPLPWLSTWPVTGTVAAGEATTIAVTFAAAGLEPAAYNGWLVLESNDPVTPQTRIPVTLTVAPGRWHAHLPVLQKRQ